MFHFNNRRWTSIESKRKTVFHYIFKVSSETWKGMDILYFLKLSFFNHLKMKNLKNKICKFWNFPPIEISIPNVLLFILYVFCRKLIKMRCCQWAMKWEREKARKRRVRERERVSRIIFLPHFSSSKFATTTTMKIKKKFSLTHIFCVTYT